MTSKKDGDMDSMGNKARPRNSVDSSVASNKTYPEEAVQGICKEHYWAWRNDPNSIPTQYNKCMVCGVIDCSEALSTSQREARIDELRKIEPLTHEGRGTIIWEMDAIASHVQDRMVNLTDTKEVKGE